MFRGYRIEDLTGIVFGRWTVIKYYGKIKRLHYWECECECGTVRPLQSQSLTNLKSRSCGCIKKEKQKYSYKIKIEDDNRMKGIIDETKKN